VLELADRDPEPAVPADQRPHINYSTGAGEDLRPAPLFEEGPLDEVRRSDDFPWQSAEPQMRVQASQSSRKHFRGEHSSRS